MNGINGGLPKKPVLTSTTSKRNTTELINELSNVFSKGHNEVQLVGGGAVPGPRHVVVIPPSIVDKVSKIEATLGLFNGTNILVTMPPTPEAVTASAAAADKLAKNVDKHPKSPKSPNTQQGLRVPVLIPAIIGVRKDNKLLVIATKEL